jgi:ribosomal protein L5
MTDSLKILNSQGKDNVFTLNQIPKILINFKIKDSKSLITCLTFLELFFKQRPVILHSMVGKKKIKVGCSLTLRKKKALNIINDYLYFLLSKEPKKESISLKRINKKGILFIKLEDFLSMSILNDEIDKFQAIPEGIMEIYPSCNINIQEYYRSQGIPLKF